MRVLAIESSCDESAVAVLDEHEGLLALVKLENGNDAPTYVAGTDNFYAITRYNQSSYYALAVAQLGEAVSKEVHRQNGRGTSDH